MVDVTDPDTLRFVFLMEINIRSHKDKQAKI